MSNPSKYITNKKRFYVCLQKTFRLSFFVNMKNMLLVVDSL